jgi:hypothetical protein
MFFEEREVTSLRARLRLGRQVNRHRSLTMATRMAAIFINSRWVQSPSRTGGLALAIQIGGWIWYFAALQTPLSG